MGLLNSAKLQASSVVANNLMNRERCLSGSNGNCRELGFEVLPFLRAAPTGKPVVWADLGCGTGRALVEAATEWRAQATDVGRSPTLRIEGIDLAGHFVPNLELDIVALAEATIESWQPVGPYRLVTCVHGLHYVGDKLAALAKAVSRTAPSGLFVANLDLANFRFGDGRPAGRTIAARLRRAGFDYDARRRLVRHAGAGSVDFGLRYLGADDTAGPNYTGQAAVDSYYDVASA